MTKKEPKLDFKNIEFSDVNFKKNKNTERKIVKINEEELKKHKEYIKKDLSKNFFN